MIWGDIENWATAIVSFWNYSHTPHKNTQQTVDPINSLQYSLPSSLRLLLSFNNSQLMAGSHCCFARGCISSSLHPFVMGNVCVSQGQTHTLCLVIRTLSEKWKTVSLYSRKQCLFSRLAHHTADAGVLFVFWNVCLISLACNLFCPWNSVYLYFTLDVTCYHFKESLCDHTKEGICVALSSAAMAVRIKHCGPCRTTLSLISGGQKFESKELLFGFFQSIFSWLTDGHLLFCLTLPVLRVYAQIPSSYRGTSRGLVGLEFVVMNLIFNTILFFTALITSLKISYLNTATFLCPGIRNSISEEIQFNSRQLPLVTVSWSFFPSVVTTFYPILSISIISLFVYIYVTPNGIHILWQQGFHLPVSPGREASSVTSWSVHVHAMPKVTRRDRLRLRQFLLRVSHFCPLFLLLLIYLPDSTLDLGNASSESLLNFWTLVCIFKVSKFPMQSINCIWFACDITA